MRPDEKPVAKLAELFVVVALLTALSGAAQAEMDLSVGWIGRIPKIDYVWNSRNPSVQGWPAPRSKVTWVAHVRNLGNRKLSAVGYRWILDGRSIAAGQTTLLPNSITELTLPWTWERKRHQLEFEIDPANAVPETEERNNRLLIYTDALAVGFWVEQTFWEKMRPVIRRAGIGCATFDDWMQRRILQFNEMAAQAIYPETPKGVLDRWRIDEIHLVPDGRLPMSPPGPEVRNWGAPPVSYSSLYPDSKDRTIDIEWGFPTSALPFYKNSTAWTLLYDSLVHELGHARYLIDVYAWDVTSSGDQIGIQPNPPADRFGTFHATLEVGMMNTTWGFIDRYSAIALNRIAGHRAVSGNYNEPSNIGVFLNDLPAMNRVRIITPDGRIFPNRKVRIYQASGEKDDDWGSHAYQLKIDNQPDLEFTTDSDGAIQAGRNPFSPNNPILAVDQNNTLAIVQLIDGKTSHWGYLEVRDFNLAYWRGQTEFATYDLIVDQPVCFGYGLGPDQVSPPHEGLVPPGNIKFQWSSEPPPDGFTLRYSVDGRKPASVNVSTPVQQGLYSVTIRIQHGKRVAWWLVYKRRYFPASCPAAPSSMYFFDLKNP